MLNVDTFFSFNLKRGISTYILGFVSSNKHGCIINLVGLFSFTIFTVKIIARLNDLVHEIKK